MFSTDTYNSTAPAAGAALDMQDLDVADVCMVGAGVVGAGVLGTSLIIATMAAPVPVIGGTVLAGGLVGASIVLSDGESDEQPAAKSTKTETKKSEATVTKFDGKTDQDIEGL